MQALPVSVAIRPLDDTAVFPIDVIEGSNLERPPRTHRNAADVNRCGPQSAWLLRPTGDARIISS
jgi:hypothetical protein